MDFLKQDIKFKSSSESIKLVHLIKFVILHIHSTLKGKKKPLIIGFEEDGNTFMSWYNQQCKVTPVDISMNFRFGLEQQARGQWGGFFKHSGYLPDIYS